MTANAVFPRVVRPPAGSSLAAAVVAILAAAVAPAVLAVTAMWRQEEYSHAWLIPPLAAVIFLYRLPQAERGGQRWPGTAIATLAVILLLAGWATRNTTLSIYGLIAGFSGLTWAALGHRAMRRLAAPIAFLAFVIPLPLAVYISLSQSLQLVSSQIGVALMTGLGVAAVRDGNIIELANGRLEVAEACNGLRYLFPLLSISYLLAVLLDDRVWKKAVLFLSGFPIAVAMNAVRVALIGLMVDRYGIGMAEGLQHEVEGFLVFAVCVALLLAEARFLLGLGQPGRFPAIDALVPDRAALTALRRWPLTTAGLWASAILAGGAVAILCLPARTELIPDRQPLALFPMSIAGWQGSPRPLDATTLGALGLTDYVLADYVNVAEAGAEPVNFYVAYYGSQRLGVQVHSPRLCIPGGGWKIVDQTSVTVADGSGISFKANRVLIEKDRVRQLVYYWFDERGRRLTSEYDIKRFALLDGFLRSRSDGALVRLVTRVSPGGEADADHSLQALTRAATFPLNAFVPR